MHWFWRAVIAAGIGAAFSVLSGWALAGHLKSFQVVMMTLWDTLLGGQLRNEGSLTAAMILVWALPTLLVTLAAFGLLTHFAGTPTGHETRCRKCNYILRGITEPRCPECGEQI